MAGTRFAVLGVFLALCGTAFSKEATFSYESVTGLYVDLPVTTTVNITDGTVTTAVLNATDSIVDAANVTQTDAGVLRLILKDSTTITANSSTPAATLTILVPAGCVSYLASGGGGSMTVNGAACLSTAQLNVSTTGLGALRVNNANAPLVRGVQDGTGTLIVTGSLGNVTYVNAGLGNAYFSGDIAAVSVSMQGQGALYISSTGAPSITGTSTGLGVVNYDKGTCSVSGGAFGAVCKQGTITLPSSTTSTPAIPTLPTIPVIPNGLPFIG